MTDTVIIAAERLKALEALEASLPELLAKTREEAKAEIKKTALDKLHERQKSDPKTHSDAVLKKYHENKADINARRRAAYQAKKAASQPKNPGVV